MVLLHHLSRYTTPSSLVSAFSKHARKLFDKMPPPPHFSTSNNREINRLLRSGHLNPAVELFTTMLDRDVVSYNSIIAGYARAGHPQHAIAIYRAMLNAGIHENPLTFPPLLGACTLQQGRQIHSKVVSTGLADNAFIGSALVSLYMLEALPNAALKVFHALPERNTAACNTVLRGYCELGLTDELMDLFRLQRDVELDAVSYSYMIKGCCNGLRVDEGRQLHCHIVKAGWVPGDLFLKNALVDLYSAAGELIDARRAMECIHASDVISWNSMVAVCADNGCKTEAVGYFRRMLLHSMRPSVRSFVGLLNLCSRSCKLQLGLQIHGFVCKTSFSYNSLFVQSALIDMYGKCSDIRSSVLVFNEISERGLECCNSLITAFLHCNLLEDAAEMVGLMIDESLKPDHVSISAALKALSSSLSGCQMLHCYTVKSGMEGNETISCSLIDSYGKCGHCDMSQEIFVRMVEPNLICVTATIAALSRNGKAREGIDLLNEMIRRGLEPDSVTFLCMLAGCDHSGMVEEGRSVLASMKAMHGVEPDRRHYACMVNLLGRAGLLEEAMEMARPHCDPKMWSSLLHSCRVHGNEEIGRRSAEALMELQPGANTD